MAQVPAVSDPFPAGTGWLYDDIATRGSWLSVYGPAVYGGGYWICQGMANHTNGQSLPSWITNFSRSGGSDYSPGGVFTLGSTHPDSEQCPDAPTLGTDSVHFASGGVTMTASWTQTGDRIIAIYYRTDGFSNRSIQTSLKVNGVGVPTTGPNTTKTYAQASTGTWAVYRVPAGSVVFSFYTVGDNPSYTVIAFVK